MPLPQLIYKPEGEALEYAYYGLNHYRGCEHDCRYCYMKTIWQKYKMGDFTKPSLRMDADKLLDKLYKEAAKLSGTKKRVQLCFSTDPYQPFNQKMKLTRDVIFILREFNIPFQVLTKGFDAEKDFDLYDPHDDLFGITMTSFDRADKLEPYTLSPMNRVKVLKLAWDAGIKTWMSLEPVIWPAESLSIIEKTHEFTELYKIGRLNHGDDRRINWQKFAADAVALCERLGVKYYLKKNLAKLLEPGSYHNTDWREVE